MNVEEKLNELIEETKEINSKARSLFLEKNKYKREMRRAKNEDAKQAIQKNNIDPIMNELNSLFKRNDEIELQILVLENKTIQEELATRESSNTVTKIDNKFSTKLKFLFTSLRRFGNFTGYLTGRLGETEKQLKGRIIAKLVEEQFSDIMSDEKLQVKILQEAGIDENDRDQNNKLKRWLMHRITEEDIGRQIDEIETKTLGKTQMNGKSDRKKMFEQFTGRNLRNIGKGNNKAYEAWNRSQQEPEEQEER